MSETILEHGYVPEEHAPDPVSSHGDPSAPGKVAIWLFLASEIMFFIAMLGTYIVLRSGSPKLFSEQARALSIPLAGANTLVLIFSSLTMALSVEAAQKGNVRRLRVCLAVTLVCACGFLGIKADEYTTKFKHHTVVAASPKVELYGDNELRIPYSGTRDVYAIIHRPNGDKDEIFDAKSGKFEAVNKTIKDMAPYAVPLVDAPLTGWRSAKAPVNLPKAAAGDETYFTIYEHKAKTGEKSTDPQYKPYYLYDGHLIDKGNKEMKIEGYRMAMPNDTSIDIHLISEEYTKNHDDRLAVAPPPAGEADTPENAEASKLPAREYTIDLAGVNSDVVYGPWKNIFYSCYFILTGVHALHVIGGMIPITILLVQSMRRKILPAHTEYVGLYWHFVDLVWIFLFPLLYLI